jgi:hypothetical protein
LTKIIDNTYISLNAYEYNGLHFRKSFGNDIKKIQKKLIENNYQVEDSNIVIKNQNIYPSPYFMSLKFNSTPESINDKIYVSPFLNEVIKDNPLKQNERSYPIDMVYPEYRSYVSTIKIPTGYKIDYLPANLKINNEQFELEYSTTDNDDVIVFWFSYFFKKSEYPADEYLKLKYYFNEIVNKGAEKLVLKKD